MWEFEGENLCRYFIL